MDSQPTREHRVIGPPGTGKTWYLSRQAERAADAYGSGEAVAIASLTKAAAEEIGSRTPDIPPANVGTLHAHAYRALERPALADVGPGLAEWNRHVESIEPALRCTNASADPEAGAPAELPRFASDGDRLLAELSTRRARMEDPAGWPVALQRFAELWTGWKRDSDRVDFTDLLERALAEVDALEQRPAVWLFDEAQDFSRLEFALARKWGAVSEQVVVVGDPDQNLYAWRGSDPDAFWRGEAASERTLDRSRRVPRAVLEYALGWIDRVDGRRQVAYLPRLEDPDDPASREVDGKVIDLTSPVDSAGSDGGCYQNPEPLLPRLVEDLAAGRSVMVLASCSYMLEPLLSLLRREGVPFHNPYRPNRGDWNPLRGARRLLAFMRPAPAGQGGENRMWTWADVRDWLEPLDASSCLERGAKTWVEAKCQPSLFSEVEPGQEKVGDVTALGRLFRTDADREAMFNQDLDWWAAHVRASQSSRYRYALTIARKRGGRALNERPRLTVGTVHSVKGGEADSVYVFPDISRTANWSGWQTGGAHADALVRLFYVAFTRARERLTLVREATPDYVALPRPDGTERPQRPRGRRLAELVKADLTEGDDE